MTTTTEPIRVFIAPINQPTRGLWKDVGGPYIDEEVREEMNRVREETGAEELILADAEGLPRSIMPKHGGVPVEKIGTFYELADLHGAEIARAYVNMFGAEIDVGKWITDAEERIRQRRHPHEASRRRPRSNLPRPHLTAPRSPVAAYHKPFGFW